jgi:SAM-dependent methyltransferase
MTSHKDGPGRKPTRRRKRSVGPGRVFPGAEAAGPDLDRGVADRQEIGDFYRAFEERFRGPRSLVKARLRSYLPFVLPLVELHEPVSAIDLGCGRGEWLELMREHGINARGVDLDGGMLQACLELGLPADEGDAISHLRALDDESQSIVSGFHIAEHLSFDALRVLVAEALRVLKPGGLLILETPNPENVVVGTTDFYVDPTHLRPIPPKLLAFLPEHQGFSRYKIVRLHEEPDLPSRPQVSLMDVLAGVSPDYAVVAQKAASDEVLDMFSSVFEQNYGVALDGLVQSYSESVRRWVEGSLRTSERRTSEKLSAIEVQTDARRLEARERAEAAEARISSLQDELRLVSAKAAAEGARTGYLEAQFEEAEARILNLQDELRFVSAQAAAERARAETVQPELTRAREEIDALAELLEATRVQANAEQARLNLKLDESLGNTHHWWQRAGELDGQLSRVHRELEKCLAETHQLRIALSLSEERNRELIHSTSWRLTGPLRASKRGSVWLLKAPVRLFKAVTAPVAVAAIRQVVKHPALRDRLSSVLRYCPKFSAHIRRFAIHRGAIEEDVPQSAVAGISSANTQNSAEPAPEPKVRHPEDPKLSLPDKQDVVQLAPRARRFYTELIRVIRSGTA